MAAQRMPEEEEDAGLIRAHRRAQTRQDRRALDDDSAMPNRAC